MLNVSKRFKKYAANMAARRSPEDLAILKHVGHWRPQRAGRRGRTWVTGYCLQLALEAIVYPQHARRPNIELENSCVRKLCLRREADGRIVAFFDKGWKMPPATYRARHAVDFFTKWTALVGHDLVVRFTNDVRVPRHGVV